MTEQDIDIRRKQLRFRAWHRGTREADLLLGPFADFYLPACVPEGVEAFARLLDVEDPDLWDWVVGKKPVAPEHDSDTFSALRRFVMEREP
jgi:antitoxin CptB